MRHRLCEKQKHTQLWEASNNTVQYPEDKTAGSTAELLGQPKDASTSTGAYQHAYILKKPHQVVEAPTHQGTIPPLALTTK